MSAIASPLRERLNTIEISHTSPGVSRKVVASPRSALKLSGTPHSRLVSRRVSFDKFSDDVLQLPERREKFDLPTPPANRLIKRVPGSFDVLSTTTSPSGEAVAFGIFRTLHSPLPEDSKTVQSDVVLDKQVADDLTKSDALQEDLTEDETAEGENVETAFSSPRPTTGRIGEHIRFAEDGSVELVRAGSWVASTLLKNVGGEETPTLTLWHECDAPPDQASAEWSTEEWAAWELSEWEKWSEAQDEEWADGEWAAEWWYVNDGDDSCSEFESASSPSMQYVISTPDSAKSVVVFGEHGRLQRMRGTTPEGHTAEGRAAAKESVAVYGVRLAATGASVDLPSGRARARKFTKMQAAKRDCEA